MSELAAARGGGRARAGRRVLGVAPGEVLAVLGPNGAGKSTALHVIAGLVRPDAGLVRLGDRVLTDTAAGVYVPTHDRRVGLLLQDPLLFPHLSVAANVAFGPRSRAAMCRGRRQGRARRCAGCARWTPTQFADRKPRQLSGGQAQRVAIARALAGRARRAAARRAAGRARRRPRPRRSARCCAVVWPATAARSS